MKNIQSKEKINALAIHPFLNLRDYYAFSTYSGVKVYHIPNRDNAPKVFM